MNESETSKSAVPSGAANTQLADAKRANFREMVTDAIRYWEPRRFVYNAVLACVIIGYFIAGLPRSRSTITFDGILILFLLAVLANACYCGAYIADLFAQFSGFRTQWQRWRWLLLFLGIAFAAVITRFFAMGIFPSNL